jgi:hypothetical protein
VNLKSNQSAIDSQYLFSFLDNVAEPSSGHKAEVLGKVFFNVRVSIGRVVRKPDNSEFASTHAKGCGMSKDDKDI